MSFKNKVVLITGGSAGIGATTAEHFAKEGANIAIVGRNKDKLFEVAQKCEVYGVKTLVLPADITKDDEVKAMYKKFSDKFGKLDILINNAGVFNTTPNISANALNVYDDMNRINVRPVILLTNLAAPYLTKSKGNIVNVASILAQTVVSNPDFGMYSATKTALIQFSKAAALELASSGVRINTVSPGPVKTDMLEYLYEGQSSENYVNLTALNRLANPSEVADVILFLASNKAMGITGADYTIDNGLKLKY